VRVKFSLRALKHVWQGISELEYAYADILDSANRINVYLAASETLANAEKAVNDLNDLSHDSLMVADLLSKEIARIKKKLKQLEKQTPKTRRRSR